jgi:hypothetical protein
MLLAWTKPPDLQKIPNPCRTQPEQGRGSPVESSGYAKKMKIRLMTGLE